MIDLNVSIEIYVTLNKYIERKLYSFFTTNLRMHQEIFKFLRSHNSGTRVEHMSP